MSDWLECLEECGRGLLETADGLLARYSRQRRRKGSSGAGRVLAAGLWRLRGYGSFLNEAEQLGLMELDQKLWQRQKALERRRIPPCRLLCRLYQQCRALEKLELRGPERWNSPSVLVGTLRRPSQLDICLIHGFYHVPVSQLPEQQIDYVAIYQSRSMFKEDCGICFYGQVKQCTVVPRWQISEIPKSSNELYYRFEIAQWEQLEEPIRVREVPFTHLVTNLFLLTHARETPELLLRSPADYRRYQSIQTALAKGDGPVFEHPGGKVSLKKGRLLIRSHGRTVAAFRASDFTATPDTVFRRMMNLLEKNTD